MQERFRVRKGTWVYKTPEIRMRLGALGASKGHCRVIRAVA